MRWYLCALVISGSMACGRTIPDTSYYVLQSPPDAREALPATTGDAAPVRDASAPVMSIEELSVDAAYDDPRIVYRTGPYRLEYYHYHRWSTAPGRLVTDFLQSGYARTQRFESVERGYSEAAEVVLDGRLLAIEEVDVTPKRWLGRVELELELRSARTGEVLWSRRLEETEPLAERSPEGLARAVSAALAHIVRLTAPELAAAARKAQGSARLSPAQGRATAEPEPRDGK